MEKIDYLNSKITEIIDEINYLTGRLDALEKTVQSIIFSSGNNSN